MPRIEQEFSMRSVRSDTTPLGPGIVLGIGLGGFFDGIVFHQLLQWHHMLSTTRRWPVTTMHGLKVNTLADGLFHTVTLVITLSGILWLWRAGRRPHDPWSPQLFYGALLAGWGAFNIVEGLVDHEVLGIHHVRSGPHHQLWDILFLIWGALLIAAGMWLIRASGHVRPRTGSLR